MRQAGVLLENLAKGIMSSGRFTGKSFCNCCQKAEGSLIKRASYVLQIFKRWSPLLRNYIKDIPVKNRLQQKCKTF